MLFSPLERMVAIRYLRARRQEGFISVITWFSLIGIGLGVATLIVVMSVMNGYRQEFFQRVIGLNGHMNIYALQGPLYDYQPLIDAVRKVPDVVAVNPTVEAQALITHGGTASGAFVRGMAQQAIKDRPTVASHIVSGSLDDYGKDDGIAIGIRMAQRLDLKVGDTLTLISPVSKTTIFGAAPRLRGYKIAAIFDVGMYEYDNNFIFMPLSAAQLFFSMGQGVTSLEVMVKNPIDIAPSRFNVINAIGRMQPEPLVRLVDWQQNSSFYTALQVESNVMFLILTMIIIVAAFNIISSLIMLVKDKGSAIAIMRTMGATRGNIMRIFFLNGACIGIAGTFFGVVLGLLVATNIENIRQFIVHVFHVDPFAPEIYFLTHMPSIVDTRDIVHIVLMSLTLSFLATLYPAWRAAKLDPVEALRYE